MSKHPYEYERLLREMEFEEIFDEVIRGWLAGAFDRSTPSTEQFKYSIDSRRLFITFAYDPSTGRAWAYPGLVNLSRFEFQDLSVHVLAEILPVPNDEETET